MKKRIFVTITFICVVIAYCVIVFKYNSDFLIKGTNFFDILMTFTAICGVFGLIYQNNQSNKLNEAQFIIDLNQQYINNENYQKLLNVLETNSVDISSPEFDVIIAECLDFFESIYILLKNGLINIMLIDELFCFRFFTIVNNRYVQNNVLTPHKNYYRNIVCFHYIWKKYKLKRRACQNIPLIDSDLSLMDWYQDACKHHRKHILIRNSLTQVTLVREALPKDIDSLNHLYLQLLGQDVLDVNITKQLNKRNQTNNVYIFIASINEKIIGAIQCTVCQSVSLNKQRYMLIENFIVDKPYRFKGVRTLLFQKARYVAQKFNVKSIIWIPNKK